MCSRANIYIYMFTRRTLYANLVRKESQLVMMIWIQWNPNATISSVYCTPVALVLAENDTYYTMI